MTRMMRPWAILRPLLVAQGGTHLIPADRRQPDRMIAQVYRTLPDGKIQVRELEPSRRADYWRPIYRWVTVDSIPSAAITLDTAASGFGQATCPTERAEEIAYAQAI